MFLLCGYSWPVFLVLVAVVGADGWFAWWGGVAVDGWVWCGAVGGVCEVPRVLFLGICLDFYYCLRRVLVPKFGFHFDRGSVSQALVKPRLVPP